MMIAKIVSLGNTNLRYSLQGGIFWHESGKIWSKNGVKVRKTHIIDAFVVKIAISSRFSTGFSGG
jgi:hypothetical protein